MIQFCSAIAYPFAERPHIAVAANHCPKGGAEVPSLEGGAPWRSVPRPDRLVHPRFFSPRFPSPSAALPSEPLVATGF